MFARFRALVPAVAAVLAIASSPLFAAGAIRGTVISKSGAAVEGAAVTLVELKRVTRTDASGAFGFESVPNGRYLLEVISPRFGSALADAIVDKDAATSRSGSTSRFTTRTSSSPRRRRQHKGRSRRCRGFAD